LKEDLGKKERSRGPFCFSDIGEKSHCERGKKKLYDSSMEKKKGRSIK